MTRRKSIFALPKYDVIFDEKIAKTYKPIVFSHLCLSGDPAVVYYRIVINDSARETCIQYFFYWEEQKCIPSHRYDYEPIFVYLKKNKPDPSLIVNGGLGGPDCLFHKNEIRPKTGSRDNIVQHFSEKMSPSPYYPFGENGSVKCEGCYKQYPLSGDDLQFESHHAMFGIIECSNVFSGAESALQGNRFSPPLKKLTDRVLNIWYFKHYNDNYDMPFGHDIADPFSFPYIKYRHATEILPKP